VKNQSRPTLRAVSRFGFLFVLAFAVPSVSRAQAIAPEDNVYASGTYASNFTTAPPATIAAEPASDSSSTTASPAADDSNWHFIVAPYLWFPGVHGIVGKDAINANISASAGDLLSHFRFGLMGVVEADRKRILLPLDIMWVRLGDDKGFPNTSRYLCR
jgi:hypothetical protein